MPGPRAVLVFIDQVHVIFRCTHRFVVLAEEMHSAVSSVHCHSEVRMRFIRVGTANTSTDVKYVGRQSEQAFTIQELSETL